MAVGECIPYMVFDRLHSTRGRVIDMAAGGFMFALVAYFIFHRPIYEVAFFIVLGLIGMCLYIYQEI
jgi:hypothetical protein